MFGPQCVKSAGADRTMSASEVRDGMSSVFGQVRSAPKDPFFVRGQGTIYFNRHGWLFGEGRRLGVDEMTAFKPNEAVSYSRSSCASDELAIGKDSQGSDGGLAVRRYVQ